MLQGLIGLGLVGLAASAPPTLRDLFRSSLSRMGSSRRAAERMLRKRKCAKAMQAVSSGLFHLGHVQSHALSFDVDPQTIRRINSEGDRLHELEEQVVACFEQRGARL